MNNAHDFKPAIEHLALAVDSHGWEDFPAHLIGDDAAEILACWTALWHPALLQHAANIPQWQRIDQLPDEPRGCIVLVPGFSKDQLPQDESQRFMDCGGAIVFGQTSRDQLVPVIAQHAGIAASCDGRIKADFFSLGYCYLQIQLMTRQLRYSSSLDEELFQESVLAAARAGKDPDSDDYKPAIQKCFDQLLEERGRYYPTTANLIDMVFLAPQTLGARLKETLRQPIPLSIQADGETIDAILQDDELTAAIKERIAAGQLCLAGGEDQELQNVLLSTWTCVRQLQLGTQKIRQLTGDAPAVFARRRFGLRVGLPGLLEQFGIRAVVHSTLDDGVFPQTSANQIRWEGLDGTTMDALVSPPHLASIPQSFLNLGVQIGEVIDINQYASQLFVHWPGNVCDYYQDLVHSSRFGPILGEFVTLTDYFENFADPGYTQNYVSDDYREPWLKQLVAAGQPDPLSRFSRYWTAQVQLLAASGWMVMAATQDQPVTPTRLDAALDEIDRQVLSCQATEAASLAELMESIKERHSATSHPSDSVTVTNPFSFRRRWFVAEENLDTEHPSVLFGDRSGVVLELPGMGVARINRGGGQPTLRGKMPLAEDVYLRNEFFEVEIDESSGGIGAIKQHGKRSNLLAQQIVLRQSQAGRSRSGKQPTVVSTMLVDSREITCNTTLRGQITSRGSLVIGQQTVAGFTQTTTVTRGLPVIDVEIQLDELPDPTGDPWQNYVACRFAWHDETSNLYSWQNESRQQVVRSRIVAPLTLQIDQNEFQTSLLAAGRPWFQRVGLRKIDGLMIVPGERCRHFRFGIGINLPYPYQSALSHLADGLVVPTAANEASYAWIFHLNCRNVVALYWIPAEDGSGLRVLLKETEGRRVELTLQCCREISAARVQTIAGQVRRELTPEGHKMQVPVCAHEMIEITLFW